MQHNKTSRTSWRQCHTLLKYWNCSWFELQNLSRFSVQECRSAIKSTLTSKIFPACNLVHGVLSKFTSHKDLDFKAEKSWDSRKIWFYTSMLISLTSIIHKILVVVAGILMAENAMFAHAASFHHSPALLSTWHVWDCLCVCVSANVIQTFWGCSFVVRSLLKCDIDGVVNATKLNLF